MEWLLISAEISTGFICARRCFQTVAALPRLQTEASPDGLDCHFMLCQLNGSDWFNVFAHKTRCIVQSCQTNWTGDVANVSIRTALHFSLEPWLIDSFDSWRSRIAPTARVCLYTLFSFPRDGSAMDIETDKNSGWKCEMTIVMPASYHHTREAWKQMWQVSDWDL